MRQSKYNACVAAHAVSSFFFLFGFPILFFVIWRHNFVRDDNIMRQARVLSILSLSLSLSLSLCLDLPEISCNIKKKFLNLGEISWWI